MSSREDLQQLDLADFTKGISTEYHSRTNDSPQIDGSAQADETYGCYGLPGGGLAPLPRALSGAWSHYDRPFLPEDGEVIPDPDDPPGSLNPGPLNPPDPDPITLDVNWEWPTVANGYPAGYDRRIAILDAKAFSPVIYSPALDTEVDHSDPPVDIYVARQWWMVNDTDTIVDTRWRFSGRSVFRNSNGLYGTEFTDIAALGADASFNPHPSRWGWGWGSITETRTQSPGPSSLATDNHLRTGIPVIVFSVGGIINNSPGVDVGGVYTYPDAATLDTVADAIKRLPDIYGSRFAGIVFGHQGRLMAITRESGVPNFRRIAYHPNTAQRGPNDTLLYWPPNNVYVPATGFVSSLFSPPKIDWTLESQDTIAALAAVGVHPGNLTSKVTGVSTFAPMEENVSGYGTWSSVDANSLFLVKNSGGGVMLNGDIDRPTVQRLPGVPSVGGFANRGANTESGYVYGSTSGVWIWAGGNTATNLAPQLHPTFWIPEDETVQPADSAQPGRQLGQLVGSFGYRWPYLYAPNNWMMDLRSGGWWRYWPTPEQDDDRGVHFAFNEVDSLGNLWAFPASHLDGSAVDRPEDDDVSLLYNENDYLIYRQFDLTNPTDYWSWKSQPLTRTRSRYLSFKSVTIVASGVGRVTVELIGLNGVSQEVEFDLSSPKRSMMNRNMNVKATDAEVKITARAGTPDGEAPTVHRVSFAFTETTLFSASGT